jgi:hypothetical protein
MNTQPSSFRTAAELDRYDEWQVRQACADCGKWARNGEAWATETLCWPCLVKQARSRG